MLIHSTERFVPTDVNMLVIEGEDTGYFYIHRSLYDQAVILDDIYGETPELLIKAITGSEESRGDVDWFLANIPKPLNIFGPFLLLVTKEIEEADDAVGAIHVMSGPINLRRMIKVPIEMRNTPTFSMSIREEYKLAWNRFFQTALPYSEDMFNPHAYGPMNGTQTRTQSAVEDYEPDGEEEEIEVEEITGNPYYDNDLAECIATADGNSQYLAQLIAAQEYPKEVQIAALRHLGYTVQMYYPDQKIVDFLSAEEMAIANGEEPPKFEENPQPAEKENKETVEEKKEAEPEPEPEPEEEPEQEELTGLDALLGGFA